MSLPDSPDTNTQMKMDILRMFDEGKIKLGQRVPMTQGSCDVMAFEKEFEESIHFEELIITEDLIKRLRTEMRLNWK